MSSFLFRTFLAALMVSSCFAPVAQAATITWDGGAGTTSWGDAANWSGDAVPGSEDDTRIDTTGVTVDGLVESTATLRVGYTGTGTLTIENGGSVTSASHDHIFIGNGSGSNGTVTVTSTGSTLESGSQLIVGFYGAGTLNVLNGGLAKSASGQSFVIGYVSSGSGTVIVTGAGSTLESGGSLFVGYSGTGSLTVSDGGSVISEDGHYIFAGYNTSSNGTITVTGSNSTLESDGVFQIGLYGTGKLTISSGGFASAEKGVNAGAYSGSTGEIVVTGSGSLLSVGHTLQIGIYENATGTLTVADSSTVSVTGNLTIASQSGSTGTLNIGAASGDTAVAPGTISASKIVFGAGTGTIVFNHTSSDYVFSTSISSAGTIEADAGTTYLTGDLSGFTGTFDLEGGTLGIATSSVQTISASFSGSSGALAFTSGTTYLTGDSSSYTGTTSVSGSGILSVNGTLGGTVDVASGGTLKGSGTVGGIDATSGGTVAPGNSIGTLSVSGDVSFASGSTYDVEADATSSDKIVATGTATLNGGTMSLIPYNGATLTAGTTYTILTAASIAGTGFDSISFADPMLFLTATLSSDSTNVYASVLRNGTSFASVAGSGNQANAAAAIESLGAGSALYDAVAMQSDAGVTRQAYQSLDGDIHANVKASLLEDQSAFGRVLAGRLAQAEDNQTGLAAPVTAKASTRERVLYGDKIANNYAAAEAKIAPTVWAQGFGGWGRRDGDGNAANFKHEDKGLMTGVDWMMGDKWRMGLAFGYDHADYTQEDGTNDKGTANRYSVSAYGGRSWGKLSLRTGLTYAYSEIDTKRAVSFPYYSDYLKGSYNAHSASGFAETAYAFGDRESKIEPYANLAWGYVNVPGFTEQGGAAALTAKDSDATLGSTTLGARVRQVLPFLTSPKNKAAFQASAGWLHTIGDVNPDTSLRFAGGSSFKTQAAPLARDAAVLGAGVDYLIGDQTTLGVAYTGQIGEHADTQAVRGNVSYRF